VSRLIPQSPLEIALWTLLCFPICLLILVAVYKLLHIPYKPTSSGRRR
jgi:hypothetical protein